MVKKTTKKAPVPKKKADKTTAKTAKTTALVVKEKAAPPAEAEPPKKKPGFDESKLSARDKERVKKWRARYRDHQVVSLKKDEERGERALKYDGDPVMAMVGVAEATGTSDPQLSDRMLGQVAMTYSSREDGAANYNCALAATHAFQPQDVLEGQLAGQMVGAHNAAMRFLSNAANSTDADQIARNVEWATKMMRTYTAQIEALNRYRGKGQQKVTVEHVTVQPGGQAIVGNVTTTAPAALPGGQQGAPALGAATAAVAQLPAAKPADAITLTASTIEREVVPVAATGGGGSR
jgi:hypothetical protein